jgi:hypothetical protein
MAVFNVARYITEADAFRIWNRWHVQERKPCQWLDEKKSPYYSATTGARTRDLPLPLAMSKEFHALPDPGSTSAVSLS